MYLFIGVRNLICPRTCVLEGSPNRTPEVAKIQLPSRSQAFIIDMCLVWLQKHIKNKTYLTRVIYGYLETTAPEMMYAKH